MILLIDWWLQFTTLQALFLTLIASLQSSDHQDTIFFPPYARRLSNNILCWHNIFVITEFNSSTSSVRSDIIWCGLALVHTARMGVLCQWANCHCGRPKSAECGPDRGLCRFACRVLTLRIAAFCPANNCQCPVHSCDHVATILHTRHWLCNHVSHFMNYCLKCHHPCDCVATVIYRTHHWLWTSVSLCCELLSNLITPLTV